MSSVMNTKSEKHEAIRDGLAAIEDSVNWLNEYEQWRNDEKNQFDSLLEVTDPFDLENSGNRLLFCLSDPEDSLDLDMIRMSIFLSERLLKELKQTFEKVRNEKNRVKKQKIIEEYFELVDRITQSNNLTFCIVLLNELADKQMVLCGNRIVDLYARFFSLREILRKASNESLYLLFTYWRITRSRNSLRILVKAVTEYIRTYFYDFNNNPDMRLDYSLEGLLLIKKLSVISHWLEFIAFHTNEIFEEYKKQNWLMPTDSLADDFIATNQISRYTMYCYKRSFPSDRDDTVRNKAVCYYGYLIWIKTVDVMYIVWDIFYVLYSYSDDDLKKMNTTRAEVLELFDNMERVRDYYKSKVFFHQVYYQLERNYLDSNVMEALEEDAKILSETVDNTIEFIEAIADDDIEALLQSKQQYISHLTGYTSEEQQKELDRLAQRIVDKIKSTIEKMDVYDELYKAVSKDFQPYAGTLVQYPKIFCSLVSAEYLFQQYVESSDINQNFDYSCISIMYYVSLEDFLNKLIYTPYANEILAKLSDDDISNKSIWKNYVSDNRYFWKNKKLKRTCEIGNIGHLLKSINKETCFMDYITEKYPKTNPEHLMDLGVRLVNIAPRRNEAAHGGNYITYSDVCDDKKEIYNTVVSEYKGMIKELLEILL